MHFMNRWDIDDCVRRFSSHPVRGKAARFLAAFRDEVDDHSDGWAYWRAPVQAANKLMTLLESTAEVTEADLRQALSPIKAFYTRRGYAAGMLMPDLK